MGTEAEKETVVGGGTTTNSLDKAILNPEVIVEEEGPILEVVLPAIHNLPPSGLAILQEGEIDAGFSQRRVAALETLKLLHIQQKVGSVYDVPDDDVVQVMVQAE
jgi:ABC-type amino acid transport substrate-binding protein